MTNRCCILLAVIWFFDKGGEQLRYEISRDRTAGRYRLAITHPDGRESIEELDQPTELIERSAQLMNTLRGHGWRVGGPTGHAQGGGTLEHPPDRREW
jgi:hypothetical protein